MIVSRLKTLSVLFPLVYAISGCASLPANSGYTSFSSYAEAVFRHQNEVSSRLMMLTESEQLPDDEEFTDTEEAMTDACELLNDYAEHQLSKDSMGWRFKRKVQDSVEKCDQSIQRMEQLLKSRGLP